jgi:hypothetical protein
MARWTFRVGVLLIIATMSSGFASAQVVGDYGTSTGWRMSQPRFGFFSASRRQAAPYEDTWQPIDPVMPPAEPVWSDRGGDGGLWGQTPWMDGCCEPMCDPCGIDCGCGGTMIPGGVPPSPVAPGTPRALPIDPANPSPEYVPRNKVPTPIETPEDPNWHKIPEAPIPVPKATPAAPEPVDLPAEIPLPPGVDKGARRPTAPRTSSRFIPVPRPTAARVMSLQPDIRR